MTDQQTVNEKIRRLNDLQLALLSCLIIDQHCIIEVHEQAITRLSYELGQVSILSRGNTESVALITTVDIYSGVGTRSCCRGLLEDDDTRSIL